MDVNIKKLLLSIITILLATPVTCFGEVRTVVPGRTWWYAASLWNDDIGKREYFDYGLKLSSDDTDREYVDCFVIGTDKKPLFNTPLCRLREQGDRVWVVPTMDLDTVVEITDSSDPYFRNVIESLSVFLPYWYGSAYGDEWIFNDFEGQDLNRWTSDPAGTEYLLYDYGMEVGDKCVWSWTGEYDIPLREYCDPWEDVESVIVESVDIDEVTGNRKLRTSQKWGGDLDYHYHLEIIEGLGVTGGEYKPFISGFFGYFGLFIGPCSLGSGAIPGMCNPGDPILMSMTESDGTCIYGDPDFEKGLGIYTPQATSPADGQIYDLGGRRIAEPARGQIYVRDGKLHFRK